MATGSPHPISAACTAAAANASPRTDPRGAPARGRGEFAPGGRADPGPRMVPTSGSSFTSLSHSVAHTPLAEDSALERLLRGAPFDTPDAGAALPPTACQWPTPGAAYRPLTMPQAQPMPCAVAAAPPEPVDEVGVLVARLAAAESEIVRLEGIVSRSGSPARRATEWARSPSPISTHSSASFATITSSSSGVTSSGGATVGATTYGKKGVPTALEPTAFDEELLPTPAAVKGRGYSAVMRSRWWSARIYFQAKSYRRCSVRASRTQSLHGT